MDPRATGLNPGLTTAALWRGGSTVTLERVALPEPGPGEVLARVRLATVCGSDLHTVAGRRAGPCPGVLGHEAVGEVAAVGPGGAAAVDGSPVLPGRRIVWSVTVGCGECDRCRAGLTAKCRTVRKVGHEPFDSSWPLSGGYAEHILLPAGTALVHVPDGVPDAVAAPAACATGTVMAALEAAGPLGGRRVLVVGVGMLGLTAVAAARTRGASAVTVTDLDPERAALAERFGATATAPPGGELPECDVALEFSGSSPAFEAALRALDVGGRIVLVGAVAPVPSAAVDPERIIRRRLTVTGVHNYEPRHLREAVDFLAATADLPWAGLVADPLPLERITELLTAHGGPPRTSVVP